jgi:hypothetical protein
MKDFKVDYEYQRNIRGDISRLRLHANLMLPYLLTGRIKLPFPDQIIPLTRAGLTSFQVAIVNPILSSPLARAIHIAVWVEAQVLAAINHLDSETICDVESYNATLNDLKAERADLFKFYLGFCHPAVGCMFVLLASQSKDRHQILCRIATAYTREVLSVLRW